ncbi:MAG: putative sulfate exporter family transporter [Muribaculaceae bacterium]|nr:putative sulfate exporter family transporter [Muribaculaceae bacterium]
MDWFIDILRHYPVIPIFFTLGVGFWFGKLRYGSFSLGSVAATLLVGIIVGQLDIPIPALVKSLFFILFLFSIGYSVGPQFFHSLRGHGWKQMGFAVIEALICAGTVVAAAKVMNYSTGEGVGLFAGSQTCSAALGVISDTVRGLSVPEPEKEYLEQVIPACYAVTYVFGAIGSAWFLSMMGPKMLGGLKKVQAEAVALEHAAASEHAAGDKQPSAGANHVETTDMVFIGLGIAVGCFIGAMSIRLKSIPISLSTTGGALLMGLFLGWYRNRKPKFGYIPSSVVWFLDNLGLNVFIAVIGITAGPAFIPAVKSVGVSLVLVGAIATMIPMIICIFLGSKVFKFSGPETLGCVAGARCGVAAIGAIQDSIGSTVPMIGYTVTYATANFILVFSSLIVLFVV